MSLHFPALVTLLSMLLLIANSMAVGRARGRYQIKAPATTGHPDFERIYRVQMNTLENTVLFLPLLWLSASYGHPALAGGLGLIWWLARVGYAVTYTRSAERRHLSFVVGMTAMLALLALASYGVIRMIIAGA